MQCRSIAFQVFQLNAKMSFFHLQIFKIYWHPRMGTKENQSTITIPLLCIKIFYLSRSAEKSYLCMSLLLVSNRKQWCISSNSHSLLNFPPKIKCPYLVYIFVYELKCSVFVSWRWFYAGDQETVQNGFKNLVDVRDVADALLLAYENPLASGRYLCNSSPIRVSDIVNILKSSFPTYIYPTK